MANVMKIALKFIQRDRDRHGNVRHYLRMLGKPKIRLPGEPGTPEFLTAYYAGLAAITPAPVPVVPSTAQGTLNALAVSYYGSAAFKRLRVSTQVNYRRIIERLRVAHGKKPVRVLEPVNIQALLRERVDHPAAANHLLRCLRALMAEAIRTHLRTTDPTQGIKRAKYEVKGYRAWTDQEINQFEDFWPTGTKPRLAFALLRYTSARRSDIVRLGRQHLSGCVLTFRQQKTSGLVVIPLHPDLERELANVPLSQLTFLARASGQPHTGGGFYNNFVDWCAAAGLPAGLSPHGMRKGSLRIMAEEGATTHEIASISGHKTLSEVQVYTDAADRVRLAQKGMAKIVAMQRRSKA